MSKQKTPKVPKAKKTKSKLPVVKKQKLNMQNPLTITPTDGEWVKGALDMITQYRLHQQQVGGMPDTELIWSMCVTFMAKWFPHIHCYGVFGRPDEECYSEIVNIVYMTAYTTISKMMVAGFTATRSNVAKFPYILWPNGQKQTIGDYLGIIVTRLNLNNYQKR